MKVILLSGLKHWWAKLKNMEESIERARIYVHDKS